ncbi:MAG: DUF1697 domain-containing protein [Deltaproteobacteria bacterium]|nr:DUF1697 domain-containing protein [Deltaproteobacteria bacterium]
MRALLLLRGVNVGGHRKLPSKTLRALLQELGLRDVQTYVQSGNAVFSLPAGATLAGAEDEAALAARFVERLEATLGFDCAALIRGATELDAIVAANPYAAQAAADPTRVHALFCAEPVDADAVHAAFPDDEAPQQVRAVAGATNRVLYFHAPGGLGRAKRTPDKLERRLKVAITARNWRTVLALQALLRQDG